MMCPDCASENFIKKGYYYQLTGTYQKYKCSVCKRVWKGELVNKTNKPRAIKPKNVKVKHQKPTKKEPEPSGFEPKCPPSIDSIADSPCFMCENVACQPHLCEKFSLWLETTPIKKQEVIMYA